MTRIPPVRRLLMDAKASIARPKNWCQGPMAMSAKGNDVDVYGWRACRFCAVGAILRASHNRIGLAELGGRLLPYAAIDVVDKQCPDSLVTAAFNDAPTTTHPMVMRLFNQAIRRAKEQGI